ncbi:MAG: metallo-beta-lactamase family protein [Parcubacteria group bacterium Licking1014_17]|nr:MAG: metallo-beta-lactamase family protein [Parcubacteria group bacterium Licking1014_17]
MLKIKFCGGAKNVTGANYLIEKDGIKILVDCGLSQGTKFAEDFNYQPFPYDPKEINYVFITHSHMDHVGRLPKLWREGFRGKVFVTKATADLIEVAMPDNMGHVISEAEQHNHEPLFRGEDLKGVLSLIVKNSYHSRIELGGMGAIFYDAGHILGSSIIGFDWQSNGKTRRIFFSGDLGNSPTPLLRNTEYITGANYLLVESTYGDRVHESRKDRKEKLVAAIKKVINNGGVLMIPSFATERTQELLFELNQLFNNGIMPKVPIFIDSPLAIKLTDVYRKNTDCFNKEATEYSEIDEDLFHFPGLTMTATVEESKAINDVPAPKIIIAGSGMSQGGRIVHHEKRYLPGPNNGILFIGYQADGSLGRRIQRGDKNVQILGENVEVKCNVETIGSYSAHADQPALLKWIERANSEDSLKKVFMVQGEEEAAKTLSNLAHDRLGVNAVVPNEGDTLDLE